MKTLKQFKEEYDLDESSMKLKKAFIKNVEPKAKADAIEAQYKGNKPAQDKADKSLDLVSKVRNRMLGLHKPVYESVDDDAKLYQARADLLNHVTNSVPSNENITKMHDLVDKVRKSGGSSEKEYDNIKHNSVAPQKYRDAATND